MMKLSVVYVCDLSRRLRERDIRHIKSLHGQKVPPPWNVMKLHRGRGCHACGLVGRDRAGQVIAGVVCYVRERDACEIHVKGNALLPFTISRVSTNLASLTLIQNVCLHRKCHPVKPSLTVFGCSRLRQIPLCLTEL